MENVVEVEHQPQESVQTSPDAPAVQSDETSAQPEQQVGKEGTEKQEVASEETPQKRESRRQRQLNRERERRIAAETELRLLREQQGKSAERPRQEPVSDDSPKREQFDTYEEFVRADARYWAKKEAEEATRKALEESKKSAERERTQGEQQRLMRDWNANVEKARDAVEDFDEVCAESEANVTRPMADAILESEHGPLIAYHLAKNPAEAERISKLAPSKQAAAIVALEEKVSKPVKQPSAAPAPINPVGKQAEVKKDPADMTDEEYAAYRRRRIAQRR